MITCVGGKDWEGKEADQGGLGLRAGRRGSGKKEEAL